MITRPKPFVFVLMPFEPSFSDIYKFGIKGAADDVGAYAERLDEQIFADGMLDRIFNQISKADVVVADMTGRNPNVFYEVGYAHALGKTVLLLTQDANDIPFDLKHRQHTVYGGNIESLRTNLAAKLKWAIEESQKKYVDVDDEIIVPMIFRKDLVELGNITAEESIPVFSETIDQFYKLVQVPVDIRNDSSRLDLKITNTYLFASEPADLVPHELMERPTMSTGRYATPLRAFKANPIDSPDGLISQYKIDVHIPTIPPRGVEYFQMVFQYRNELKWNDINSYRLRFHTSKRFYDYPFKLKVEVVEETVEEVVIKEQKG